MNITMEGINTLNKTEITYVDFTKGFHIGFIIALVVAVVIFLLCIFKSDDLLDAYTNIGIFFESLLLGVLIGSLVWLLTGLITSIALPEVHTGKYRYEVTLDDSVSVNKLLENYEIVSQRGEIYTIELKEEDKEGEE